ncbi:MAG TPA: hypothetical protein VM759_07300 [Longimicrobium sp.]|nr:hypothetical protein [Longimicrobium sp.]
MNEANIGVLVRRVESLERRIRRGRRVSVALGALLAMVSLGGWIAGPRSQEVIRARTLIIEDEQGRDRVVLGAPVPSALGTTRISPSTGMVINDTAGHERFGLGLMENGRMGMGFDAAPGNGDPRNPERLNLGVDPDGNGYVRYLDKRTGLAGYLGLREDDRVWLEFVQVSADSVIRRRLGLTGDDVQRQPR